MTIKEARRWREWIKSVNPSIPVSITHMECKGEICFSDDECMYFCPAGVDWDAIKNDDRWIVQIISPLPSPLEAS